MDVTELHDEENLLRFARLSEWAASNGLLRILPIKWEHSESRPKATCR